MNARKLCALLTSLCAFWTTIAHADGCTSEEAAKLRSAGFSEDRISQICGKGETVRSGPNAGLETLTKLAEQGNAEAAFELGKRYEEGNEVIRDYVQAYVWYSRAHASSASQVHKAALDALEAKMSPTDIEKAQSAASTKTAPAQGNEPTQPKCTEERVVRWRPHQVTLNFDGSSDSKALGYPSENYACQVAKRDSRDLFDGVRQECQSKLTGSNYRNVRGKEVPGQCSCEDNRTIGLGFSCDYSFDVVCDAEERFVDTVRNCF